MKATAYNTIAFLANRTRPVFPVRELGLRLPLILLVVILLLFFFTMVHLQVQKAHYGQLIQRQMERVEALNGDVRALQSKLASMTALPSIRQQALERGMIEPKLPPHDLVVRLTSAEIAQMGGVQDRDVIELFVRRWNGGLMVQSGEEGNR